MSFIRTISEDITAGGWTAVPMPTNMDELRSFSIMTLDQTGFYVAEDSSGTGSTEFPANMPLAHTFNKPLRVGGGVALAYVKGTTSTKIVGTAI